MRTVTSADGTTIAFDQLGDGPPVITVVGAFNDRSTTAPLAEALAPRFTVLNYDRRGRGVQRRRRVVCGRARGRGPRCADRLGWRAGGGVRVLVRRGAGAQGGRARQLAELVAAGRRGEAVELYQLKGVGLPQEVVVHLRHAPFRPGLEAIAHTLVYDAAITGDLALPTELAASIAQPTLVIDGGASWGFLRSAAAALADALPNGQRRTLPNQTHDINPEVTASALTDFLAS